MRKSEPQIARQLKSFAEKVEKQIPRRTEVLLVMTKTRTLIDTAEAVPFQGTFSYVNELLTPCMRSVL